MATWPEVAKSIEPYWSSPLYWTGLTWKPLLPTYQMVDKKKYWVRVSQDCTLDWDGYHYDFEMGENTFIWLPAGVPLPECTLWAAKCEGNDLYQCQLVSGTERWVLLESNSPMCEIAPPPGDIITTIPLTLTIPPAVIEDIVATIPLTLTIPSIEPPPPPPPPDDDWGANISAWLTENWYMAVAAIVIFLIGIFVWARYK